MTRNCPWNRCRFCPVYKGAPFSRRPVDQVLRDIEAVHGAIAAIGSGGGAVAALARIQSPGNEDLAARRAALHWLRHGCRHVFLQDADSLIIPTGELLVILHHLRERFPQVDRITSYARARTIARLPREALAALRLAGLNRLHLGLESGADAVLARIKKGASRATHIAAGQKVKEAGIELSEYYMPGLGGRDLMRRHAVDSATALNEINPDFIRLRTLAIPESVPLYEDYRSGRFAPCSEVMVVRELEIFLEHLQGITSRVVSDHILNLLSEVEGDLPRDREAMLAVVRRFLAWPPERQRLFQVGRRLGVCSGLDELEDPLFLARVQDLCRRQQLDAYNVDQVCGEIMRRFI